ncbi:MAG: LTA synthase family protein [Oscillospiraceae bacterium]|nr:LTA synthase family protein [Oscillospiraceae bacterium]
MFKEKTLSIKNFSEYVSVLYIPLSIIYLELALRIKCGIEITDFLLPLILLSGAFGLVLSIVSLVFKKEIIRKVFGAVFIFALCLYFVVEAFVNGSYQVFMTIDSIARGTGGVLTDFSDAFIKAITGGFFAILAMFLPFIVFIVLCTKKFDYSLSENKKASALAICAAVVLVFTVSGTKIIRSSENMFGIYQSAYNFDNAARSFGLITGTRLDYQYEIFGNPSDDDFVIEEPESPETPAVPEEPSEDEPINDKNEEKEYGFNVTDIDFETAIASTSDSSVINVHKYISSLSGTKQNDYTGLFKGKNLILIAAESFSKEIIDPELTPTLYRLSKNGFTFNDYYQPTWGGSTSTGEFSIFSGIIPTSGVGSILRLCEGNTNFTIGNKLLEEGYFSASYHNGSYDYYSRNLTHTKLGYKTFEAFGNGLENKMSDLYWPASDLELFEGTISDYINSEPFSVYYMTVSGHGFYTGFNHAMAARNRELVEHLDYSTTVQSYIAANLELEHALSFLVSKLEEAGIADDTVIVLTSDHYPYALEKGESWGNDEDYLAELYGFAYTDNPGRDHNALIIWSGCLENEHADMATDVDEPTYSLDILPTLCNLFGVTYDSRLLVGRDVFSGSEAIVIWPDYNWKTKLGYYNYTKREFVPSSEEISVDKSYIEYINNIVKNKIAYSKAVINHDYFGIIENFK